MRMTAVADTLNDMALLLERAGVVQIDSISATDAGGLGLIILDYNDFLNAQCALDLGEMRKTGRWEAPDYQTTGTYQGFEITLTGGTK